MARVKSAAWADFSRAAILDAAERLFAEQGAAKAAVDDIARAAGCSKSTLYQYFRSKDELSNQLVLRNMERLRDGVQTAVVQGESARACFFAICGTIRSCAEAHPAYVETLLGSISVEEADWADQPALSETYRVGEEINELVAGVLRRGQERGELRTGLEPVRDGLALWAAISGNILLACNKQKYLQKRLDLAAEAFLNSAFELIWRSIAAGEAGI